MEPRREFIKKTLLGTAGIAAGGLGFSAKSYASIMGANERINMAVIGIHGRGQDHIKAWAGMKDVKLKTLCDVHTELLPLRSKLVVDKTGHAPHTEWDMRKVFEDKDIDAVSFATPNFWHALGTVWACQAGKHVYVEKPCCHDIGEGLKMIAAAEKYDRRVQVGFQNRSIREVMEAIKFLHEGGIGEVFMARGLCIKPRASFGIAKDSAPPATLHYDMWLGPVAERPYNEKRDLYNWHWFWDTGNGDTGNQGPHQFDIARWGLNKNENPVSVFSSGGIYGWSPEECAQETPDTQVSVFKYQDGSMLEFETRGRASNSESDLGIRIGNIFYGKHGYLEINGSTWKAYHHGEDKPFAGSGIHASKPTDPTFLAAPDGSGHFANFIDTLRTGNSKGLHCEVSTGYLSTVLPLMANISYRLKRELRVEGTGTKLQKFINDPEADAMLTSNYRAPYLMPADL
jgi:predicted dehydrogenase